MFSVLLVDDEKIILQGLKHGFDWASHNFEVVGEASDGIEAIKKIKDLNPDIVITDIRMPKYDGIEFMKALKASHFDTEIVVLSGYDDFMYAKEALDAGAFTYLLKPVNLDVLSETINKLKDKIEKKRKLLSDEIVYNSIKAEELIMEIIAHPEKVYEILENNPGFSKKTSSNYFVAFISADDINAMSKNFVNVSQTLKKCIGELTKKLDNYTIKIQFTQTQYIIVFFIKDVSSYNNILKELSEFLVIFSEKCDATATIGISGIFRNIKLISTAYHQSEFALSSRAIQGKNRIIDYLNVNTTQSVTSYLSSADIETFSALLRQRDYTEIKAKLERYFSKVMQENNININTIKSNIAEIATLMLNVFNSDTEMMKVIFGRDVKPDKELYSLNTVKEIQTWILEMVDAMSNSNILLDYDITNENVKRAILYIAANYNKKLTIEIVANKLYISSRQLMRCFKQETGLTFNDYLTNYRMKKATQLFETKKYAIYEVSQLVGYNDSRHFCKLFKKITGKNPGEIK